jgi:hypothetical protein
VSAPIQDPGQPAPDVPPSGEAPGACADVVQCSPGGSWALPQDAQGRLRLAAHLVTFAVLVIYVFDQVWPAMDVAGGQWVFRSTIPVMRPVGADFHNGIYNPAMLLRSGESPYKLLNYYPPLVAVLGLPFTFLKPGTAYLVHAVGLAFANLATIWLSMAIAVAVFGNASPLPRRDALGLGQIMAAQLVFFAFTGYPLHFSLERGNVDIYPQLLSVAALYFLLKRPRSLWLQVVLISLAVHIKVYPAILFLLIFWRHRWKCVVPIAVVNGGLLLMLGFQRALEFLRDIRSATVAKTSWIGNHSATSFSETVLSASGFPASQATKVVLLFSLALWAIGVLVLWRRKFTPANAVLMFALSIPVMHIVPAVSHDYKIVILTAPFALVIFACIARFAADGTWPAIAAIAVLLVAAGGLARSYADTTTPWLANKCPWILLAQMVFLAAVLVPGVVLRGRAAAAPASDRLPRPSQKA